MPTIMGRHVKYYFCDSQLFCKYLSVLLKIVFVFIVYVILPIFLVLNFINQFHFPSFFVIDHGNEYETIKY